jgi:hypothetical protein
VLRRSRPTSKYFYYISVSALEFALSKLWIVFAVLAHKFVVIVWSTDDKSMMVLISADYCKYLNNLRQIILIKIVTNLTEKFYA